MGFFRNPEIKKMVIFYVLLTAVISGAGFVFNERYGIVLLAICLIFDAAAFVSTYKRYQKIAKLSQEIDDILHGKEVLALSEYSEGELSILQNEIAKMTVRLREQSNALQKDKEYLADSIADISHQIRTPLTSINLILSFLSQPNLTEERRAELVQELVKLMSRMDWLITALLKSSKLDAGTVTMQKCTVSVTELIRRSASSLVIPMELRNQQLHVSVEEGTTFVGDLSWSTEAIGNILKNCMEHTPDGGSIEIHASENTIYTEIVVRDNGPGISEEDLPHLFERFYKGVNSSEQSIGIGLALARMIIVEQNGTIRASNRKRGGAKFTVRFYKEMS